MAFRLSLIIIATMLFNVATWGMEEVSIEEKDLDKGNKARIILENEFIKASIAPFSGGVIDSLTYMGGEFTKSDGVLGDHMWDQRYSGDFHQKPYMYEIKREPESVSVRLWRKGRNGAYKFIEIRKEITLRAGRSALEIAYEFKNLPHSRMDITIKPWFHHVLGDEGPAKYVVPTVEGARSVDYDPAKPGKDVWFHEPVRPWSAVIGDDEKGVVCMLEYPWLKCFYSWFCETFGTLEWRFFPITIPCGECFATSFTVMPFHGLKEIDGAGGGLVGSIIHRRGAPDGEVLVVGDRDRTISFRITTKRPRSENGTTVASGQVKLRANQKRGIPFKVEKEGDMVIQCEFRDLQGDYLADVVKPFLKNKVAEFQCAPREKRHSPPEETFQWRYRLDRSFVRPHFNLAKPFAGGNVKTYFIMPSNTLRDVIELSTRMDVDPAHSTLRPPYCAPWVDPESTNSSPVERQRIVNQKGIAAMPGDMEEFAPEVIVIGAYYKPKYNKNSFSWDSLEQQARDKILEWVKNGAGLVFICPTNVDGEMKGILDGARPVAPNHYICHSFPFELFKGLSPANIKVAEAGKGRVVVINRPAMGLVPYYPLYDFDFAYEEFLYSLLSKAIYWADGKDRTTPPLIGKAERAGKSVKIPLQAASKARKARITIWRGSRIVEKEYEINLADADHIDINTENGLMNGRHFANVNVEDDNGKTLDWAIIPFDVSRPLSISGVTMERDEYQPDDDIDVKVKLKNERAKDAEELTLTLDVYDNHDRLLRQNSRDLTLEPGDSEESFTFNVERPLTVVNRVEATLNENAKPIDTKAKSFLIPAAFQHRSPFTTCIWMDHQEYPPNLCPDITRTIKDLGFDQQYEGTTWGLAESARIKAEANVPLALTNVLFTSVPSSTLVKYQKTKDKDLLMRKPCLSDPGWREKANEKLQITAELASRYGALQYMLGDEMSLTTEGGGPLDICFSPHCLNKFRRYLRDRHGNLERLNQAWKTNYSSWEEIEPLTYDEAVAAKKYGSWMAHRSFMDGVWADWFGFCSDCVRNVDPAAYIGECGIQPKMSTYGGYDWSKKMRQSKTMAFYGLGDIPISFADRSKAYIGSYCMGYGQKEANQQFRIWQALLHGQNTLYYWYAPILIKPDLSLSPYGKYLKKYLDELENGIGLALASADYVYSPIAIHHSQKSCQMSTLLKQGSVIDTNVAFIRNLNGWNTGLAKWGYRPRFVSTKQIKQGILDSKKFNVLILPLSYVITDSEGEKIKQFVENGGTLIADAQTGLYDEYGNQRDHGILDEFMGVARSNSNLVLKASIFTNGEKTHAVLFSEKGVTSQGKSVAKADRGMQTHGNLTFGLEGTGLLPQLREFNVGKGRVIYLGGANQDFGRPDLIVDLLESSGVSAPARVLDAEKTKRIPVEVGRFRSEGVEYLVILRPPETERGLSIAKASMKDLETLRANVSVTLPREGHVYDVRAEKYLGYEKAISDTLAPGIAKLYAILPEKPQMTVTTPDQVRQGESLTLRVSGNEQASCPVQVDLISPDGEKVSYLSGSELVPPEGLVKEIPFSLNAETGTWRLRVRPTITGKVLEKTFAVKTVDGE